MIVELNLNIQIDFFEPIFIPAIRQKLFNHGQFGLTPVKNILLHRFCVVTHQKRTSSLLNSLLTKFLSLVLWA